MEGVGGAVSELVTVLLLCLRDPSPKYETKIIRLVWQSWTHSEEDRKWELAPLWGLFYFACLKWLLERVGKNKILLCCPEVHGFAHLLVGQLLLWDEKHHLNGSFVSDLGQISHFRIGVGGDINRTFPQLQLLRGAPKLPLYCLAKSAQHTSFKLFHLSFFLF